MHTELSCGHIRISITPVEPMNTPPSGLVCHISVAIRHPTGNFEYNADDVCLEISALKKFAMELGVLAKEQAGQAVLVCMSQFFRMAVLVRGSEVMLNVQVEDYVPNYPNPKLIGSSSESGCDLLNMWQRRINELIDEAL